MKYCGLFLFFFSALSMDVDVYAQTRGSTGTSGGSGPSRGTVPQTPTTTVPTTNTTQNTLGQRTIPIYGKVMLSEGMPPSDSVTIKLQCGSVRRSVGYTDSKGHFSVDLGTKHTDVFADASESGAQRSFGDTSSGSPTRGSSTDLVGCDLIATLPGFRADPVSLSNHRSLDDPNVGTIILHRLANVQGLTISATSELAPKDARKSFEKGLVLVKKDKLEEAEQSFQKAVDQYPKYATAWFELGRLQQRRSDYPAARKSYGEAISADAKFVPPYQEMAVIGAHEKNWQDAADNSEKLLRLNAVDFPMSWYLNALANLQLGKLPEAEKSAREGIQNDPDHHVPKSEQLLATILIRKHDYANAAEHIRTYLALAPDDPEAGAMRQELAKIETTLKPAAENRTTSSP